MSATNEGLKDGISNDSLPSQDGSKDLNKITPEVLEDTRRRLEGKTVPLHRRKKKRVPFGFIKRKI